MFLEQTKEAAFQLPDNQQALLDTYGDTPDEKPMKDAYDVIVVSGEPEGVATAVAAARNGADTLLVESRDGLGGLFTYGWLNFIDMTLNDDGEVVSKGIFEEWHELVGNDEVFRVDVAQAAFNKLVEEEENLTVAFNTKVDEPVIDESNTMTGLTLTNDEGTKQVSGARIIDATQDADLAAAAGVPYTYGAEDLNQEGTMAVTPMVYLKDVNWFGIREAAKQELFGTATVSDTTAHGFSELHTMYTPSQDHMRLRGLNIARIGEDEVYINALQIFGVNGTKPEQVEDAMKRGKRESAQVLAYLREHFPGFEDAKIAAFPPELYVRETRHIQALYQLDMSDVWANRDFDDTIAVGAYPVDVQAHTVDNYGYVISNPNQYGVPFRSIVPQDVKHLLVVGRSAGFTSLAAGSARIVPTGMAVGQAAGTAAAQSIAEDISFREMAESDEAITTLRENLIAQGQYIPRFKDIAYPYKGDPADEAIQTLMDTGILVGGYDNDLGLDQEMNHHSFVNLVRELVKRTNGELFEENIKQMVQMNDFIYNEEPQPLTPDKAAEIILTAFGESAENGWQEAALTTYLTDETRSAYESDQVLRKNDAYMILADFLNQIGK
ncbi:FAD-dependent oxidoreductase [Aureibacillus halotolerans]|uniref:FAD dependent oxidoreductase n=1 Tax=Aureibacillus halotolerans TaxID=1508390 RepID=A0A4R6TVH8_9BACI|nr:FAD-dependent oxidoreductase [Aureibacillus halotolerans]TDQ37206.1 FAD dependent oxidoreductase [Aureibacillus halotolerans]